MLQKAKLVKKGTKMKKETHGLARDQIFVTTKKYIQKANTEFLVNEVQGSK